MAFLYLPVWYFIVVTYKATGNSLMVLACMCMWSVGLHVHNNALVQLLQFVRPLTCLCVSVHRDLFTPPRGVYTPPCDMSTHPLGRTPRGSQKCILSSLNKRLREI